MFMDISVLIIGGEISNIFARGDWHSESIFTKTAVGLITGFKGYVYELGLQSINYY